MKVRQIIEGQGLRHSVFLMGKKKYFENMPWLLQLKLSNSKKRYCYDRMYVQLFVIHSI